MVSDESAAGYSVGCLVAYVAVLAAIAFIAFHFVTKLW